MSTLSRHAIYSREQVSRYLVHIGLPQPDSFSLFSFKNEIAADPLRWLTKLQRRQMARMHFENLALQYSTHHSIILDLDVLYDKMVTRAKGGYCMENNRFFATILRTLGYTVLSGGARVSNAIAGGCADGGYTGLYGLETALRPIVLIPAVVVTWSTSSPSTANATWSMLGSAGTVPRILFRWWMAMYL